VWPIYYVAVGASGDAGIRGVAVKRRRGIPEELAFAHKHFGPWGKGDMEDALTDETSETELTEEWAPTEVVHTFTPGRDGVPTVDDDLDADPHAAPRVYPAWDADSTLVRSGPIGRESKRRGRAFATRQEARAYWTERGGPILEEYRIFRGYAFRQYKVWPRGA
jgi:hypothetical protein